MPSPAVEVAPDLLRLAADALEMPVDESLPAKARTAFAKRQAARARVLVRAIDWTAFDWFWTEGGLEWERRHSKASHGPYIGPKAARTIQKATLLQVAVRDQWTCRYCDLRVLSPRLLREMHRRLPSVLPLGDSGVDDHPAYMILRWTYDHVVPHAAGGTNDPQNLVTSCGACNFNKGNCTLDELRLSDPRLRDAATSGWGGLSGRLGTAPI